MTEQALVREEALGWEFRGLGFTAQSARRSRSGFGEFLKPLWKSVFLSVMVEVEIDGLVPFPVYLASIVH